MKKYLISLILIFLLTSCVIIETDDTAIHTVMIPPEPTEEVLAEPTPKPETVADPPITITLGAVGDVLASQENLASAKSGDVFEFSGHFQSVRETFRGQDFTIANLVSPIAGPDYPYGGYPNYNAPKELAQALSDIGIDALNTANRYSLDLGSRAVLTNLGNIRDIGLTPFGTASTQDEAEQLTVVSVKGIRIGLISYTAILNQVSPNSYAVSRLDQAKLTADIANLRAQGVDIISVSLYWGEEYADLPNDSQMELMNFLESQGVDIVLGSYPHVIQPMVMKDITYNGVTKPMVQAYSLGNFYSAFLMNRTKTGLMLEIEITKADGVAKISRVDHSFIYNHQTTRQGDVLNYQLINLDDLDLYYGDPLYAEMASEKERAEALLRSLDE